MNDIRPTHLQSPPVSFQGSIAKLQPYTSKGTELKPTGEEEDRFFKRVNIQPDNIYERIIDPKNTTPLLLTGAQGSGKSTVAKYAVEKLASDGHAVILVDEHTLRREGKRYLDREVLERIKQKTDDALKDHKRMYLFIDEPQYIPERESDQRPDVVKNPRLGTLQALKEYVLNHPEIRLVGIMHSDGFADVEKYTGSPAFRRQLNELFPANRRIELPDPLLLPKPTLFSLIDSVLETAGFAPVPENARDRMEELFFFPREILRGLEEQLTRMTSEGRRQDTPDVNEIIPDSIWNRLIDSLQVRSRARAALLCEDDIQIAA